MTAQGWISYRWDLVALDASATATLAPYAFAAAHTDDHEATLRAIQSATKLENSIGRWDSERELTRLIERAFDPAEPECVVVRHGTRIIAASVLNLTDTALPTFITGPTVLHEYRNRGIGSMLLLASLLHLKDRGEKTATACAAPGSIAARFVYPKFGGTPTSTEISC